MKKPKRGAAAALTAARGLSRGSPSRCRRPWSVTFEKARVAKAKTMAFSQASS
jgi:hypothetical protein